MPKRKENRGFSAFFELSGTDSPKKLSVFGKFTANAPFSRIFRAAGRGYSDVVSSSSSMFGIAYHLPSIQMLQ